MLISSASQKLHLPPDVQVRRRGNTYIIYYDHDEVGGVVVSETPSGDTQLRPHVKEPVELNKDIVALVGVSLEIGNFCTLSALFNQSWFVRG